MSIWKTLFSTGDIVEKGLDVAVSAGDKLVLTNEEKVDYHLRFLKAYEPFKIAQRFLALIVGVPFVSIWVLCAIVYMLGSAMVDPLLCMEGPCRSESMMRAAVTVGQMNNDTLGTPFVVIIGFYFAGGVAEGSIRAWKQKGEKE